MKLILASDNNHKLREFRELFRTMDVELLSKREAGITEEVEETGTTFAENAFIKAEAVMKASGLPAIADDSGLSVDALGGEPGVHLIEPLNVEEMHNLMARSYLEGYSCSNSELTMEEKNAISHRGKALRLFKEEWEKYYADK